MFKKWILLFAVFIATAAFGGVEVNTASEADLDSINGIGPATSAKILKQRRSSKFADWNDFIQRTSGIGAKRAAKLSTGGLRVNGLSYDPNSVSGNVGALISGPPQTPRPQRNLPIAIAPRN